MEPKLKKNGRYAVRWREKRGTTEVRQQRTFDKRKDAIAFIESLATERRKDRDAGKRTFNDYADRYIESATQRCKARTVIGYASSLRHARAFMGDRQVGTLRKSDAEQFLTYLGKQLRGRRVRSTRAVWRTFAAVLDDVVDDEALASNPACKVKLPTANARSERRFKPSFLRPQQVTDLASNLPHPYGLLVTFAAYTGLRRGEIAGLNMGHMKLLNRNGQWTGRVTVEQTARRAHGEWHFDTPKTDDSTREVPLSSWLAEQMHAYIQEHPHPNPSPDHPLWPGRARAGNKPDLAHVEVDWSERWEPESFCRNLFAPAARKTGSQRIRFHDLRHTFASLCAHNGVPVARVSAWMGHSTISITLDTYTHLFQGEEDVVAIEALNAPPAVTRSNVVSMGRLPPHRDVQWG